MADQKGLRFIGFMLGAATAAVMVIAATFVATVDPGAAEQSAMVFTSSRR
jgi:hypothetical protein